MSTAIEIVNIVLPVFLIIGLGQYLARQRFLSPATVNELSRTVFYVAAPLLLFRSAALTSLSESLNLTAIAVIVAVTAGQALIVYLLVFRAQPSRRGVLAQGGFRSNLVFVGYPIIMNAFGDKGLGLAAIYVGFVTVLYNFVAVIILTLPHRGAEGAKVRLGPMAKSILTNPLIISCVAGLAASALGIKLPTALDRGLKLGGDLATPLALLVVGASLDLGRIRSEFKPAFLVSLVKLFVYPGLVYASLYALGLRGMFLQTPVLLLASPTAVVSHVMAREMKGDDQLAGAIVIGSTLLSLFTISAWLAFFHWMG